MLKYEYQDKIKTRRICMNPYITEITPFTVAGLTIRIKLPNMHQHAYIPNKWIFLSQSGNVKKLCKKQEKRVLILKKYFKEKNNYLGKEDLDG